MTRRERVLAALRGEAADRTPVSAWRHFYDREHRAQDLADAMCEFQHAYDWDFMKINPRASYLVEGWGCIYGPVQQDHSRQRVGWPIRTPADWTRLSVLTPREGALHEQVKAILIIKRHTPKDLILLETVFTPLSLAADLAQSPEAFLEDLRTHPAEVRAALEVITATLEQFVQSCAAAGTDGLFFATRDWASQDRLSAEEYRQWGRPYDLRVLKAAGGDDRLNVLHVCKSHNLLETLSDYPVGALHWDATDPTNPSLADARRFTAKGLMGGINHQTTLPHGTPGAVQAEALGAIAQAGGPLVLSPGCTFSPSTPADNVRALRRAVDAR